MIEPDDRRARFETVAGEVIEPLQRYLGRRLPPEDAQDALGDVLLTLWRRLDEAPIERVLPWSYGVARLTVANHHRSRRRRLRLVERLEAEPQSGEPDTSPNDLELSRALASLPFADQEVLRLWAWEQLEAREIAEVLGIGVNAATLRLSRARKKLGAAMRRQSGGRSGHTAFQDTEEQSDA